MSVYNNNNTVYEGSVCVCVQVSAAQGGGGHV